uniref:B3 domain-containing protein Os07g0563300-like n=1 Tax=Erigeron canadensis TaxID=72917 RepID=UPI001CB8E4B0|nr:B3 domain-containing protein Os07g0563300-like [Erigeron canadensis]
MWVFGSCAKLAVRLEYRLGTKNYEIYPGGKMTRKVHLECEVSHDSYTMLQGGEVMCNGCVTPDVILISVSEETLVNSTNNASPVATVPTLVVNDQLTDQENVLNTNNEELAPKTLSNEYNGNNVYTEITPQVQAPNRKPKSGAGRKNKQYRPRMTKQELKELSNRFNVKVKPLFEKRLTSSDVGTGRLVIPKQCAEDYFPSINDSKGKCLVILDADRKDWKFNFKFWPNTKTRIYFLEGFNEFEKSVKLRQGDKVTFSRLVCEGTLVIGYRKRPSTTLSSRVDPFHKATTASTSTKRARKENPNELDRLRLNTQKVKVFIHSQRESTYEIGSSSKTTKKVNKRSKVKDARELVASPEVVETRRTLIENVDTLAIHSKRKSTYEIGSRSKSTKNVNKRSKSKNAQELIALPEAAETQVTPIENVVTLPSQPNVNKKHPRHRLDCLCIVCIQPASGCKHHVSCECRACVTLRSRGKKHSQNPPQRVASRRPRKRLPKPTLQIESSNAGPPMMPNLADQPGSSNHTHQTTVISRVPKDDENTNLSSMHSKILSFDLNFPPADFE